MAQSFATIFNPEGEPETHLRANCVDLTRHCGYTWRKGGEAATPADKAPVPKEEDNAPDVSGEGKAIKSTPALTKLKTKATTLGVVFDNDTVTQSELKDAIKQAELAAKAEKAAAKDDA